MRVFISVTGAAAVAAAAVTVVAVAGGTSSSAVPVAATQPAAAQTSTLSKAPPLVTSPTPATKASAHPKAKRTATARSVVKHAAPAKPRVRQATHHTSSHSAPSGPTSWGALNAAIARIPTYHSGGAHWVVKDTGWWGTADWDASIIYISPATPESKLYDVAVHEWSHILSVRDYGGDVVRAVNAMQLYFSGKISATDLMPAEDAADCMAIVQGADWTDYTSCSSSRWRAGARALVAGHKLPGISL